MWDVIAKLKCIPLSLRSNVERAFKPGPRPEFCSPWDQIRFGKILERRVEHYIPQCPPACDKEYYSLDIVKRVPIGKTYFQNIAFTGRQDLPFVYFYQENISSYFEHIPPDAITFDLEKKYDVDRPFVRRMKKMAGLHLTFKHSVYSKITRDIRAGTPDKVAVLGGILGLFSGISIVSIVEAVYWIYVALGSKCSRVKSRVGKLFHT